LFAGLFSNINFLLFFLNSAGMGDDAGIWWVALMYFCFCVVSPIAVTLVAAFLWLVPLQRSTQRTMLAVGEILNAWSALEVFVVAVLASLLQVQQFAAFIVGDTCEGINKVLKNNFDEQLDGDDKCLDVIAELTGYFWYMLAAALMLMLVSLMTFYYAAVYLHQKQDGSGSMSQGEDSLFLPLLSDISDAGTFTTDNSSFGLGCKCFSGNLSKRTLRTFEALKLVSITGDEVDEKPSLDRYSS
jgi:hypothetical protein